MMGKALWCEAKDAVSSASDLLSKLIVTYPSFLPAYEEKMRLQLLEGHWEQANETAARISSIDANNVEALRMLVLYALAKYAPNGLAFVLLFTGLLLFDLFLFCWWQKSTALHFLFFLWTRISSLMGDGFA